jgi:hypothetical protein
MTILLSKNFPTLGEWKRAVAASASSDDVVTYPGFDKDVYPGNSDMLTWWNDSPFFFTGFYLGKTTYHTDDSWMSARATLTSQGWGFCVIYVGQQLGGTLTSTQGTDDAIDAYNLAVKADFPAGTIIFLDIETGGTLSDDFLTYILYWVYGIQGTFHYNPGIYCNSSSASQIAGYEGLGDIVSFWCVNVNCDPSPGCTVPSTNLEPSSCGYSDSLVWQYAQSPKPAGISCGGYTDGECERTYGGVSIDVDLDTSTSYNPSNG